MTKTNVHTESVIMTVAEASRLMLARPATVYYKIAHGVFPAGVIVRLGTRSVRFHRTNLLKWLEAGGCRVGEGLPIRVEKDVAPSAVTSEVNLFGITNKNEQTQFN